VCNTECVEFVMRALPASEVSGKRVIEVGSYDVNGSVRSAILGGGAESYVGVDIAPGPSVDVIQDATRLTERFESGSFDVVLSTEVVEHVRDWRAVFVGMKALCAPGGVVVVTTRSPGFGYHPFPEDYWRFTTTDMQLIFADFDVEMLESQQDRREPGVFVKARRGSERAPLGLDPIALNSILTDRREIAVGNWDICRFKVLRRLNLAVKPVSSMVPEKAKAPLKKWLGFGPGF
jgi:SAM-dependent methyltransferase